MANYKSIKHNKIAIGVLFALFAVLAVGLVAAMFRIDTQIHTETLTAVDYEVGSIDENEGTNVATAGSIRSKSLRSVDGLTITLKNDANVTYKIFCYNEDGTFISWTSSLSEIPASAELFRIVVTPTESVNINIFTVKDYSGQLVVTYNK